MSFKKIILENFQSHAFTEINLHKGLNVITGESDRGKSAVIRALNWLIYNEPRGADFIRAGERECRVTVYLEDGGSVQRERTPSLNRYIVNEPGVGPQVYEGFGTRVPEEVSKALGVGQVMLDDNLEVSLNISKQLDPPFLISEPGSLKSKSIGRLYNVHIIDGAVRDTVRDINDLQREDRRLAREIEDMDKELKKYENLPSLVKRLEKTQLLIEHLDELRSKGGQLAILAKRAQEIRDDTELQKRVVGELAKINPARDLLFTLGDTARRWQNLCRLKKKLDVAKTEQALEKTSLEATVKIGETGYAINQININFGKLTGLKALATKLQIINRGKNNAGIILAKTAKLRPAAGKTDEYRRLEIRLSRLVPLGKDLEDVKARIVKGNRYIGERRRDIESGLRRYETVLRKMGRCPVCLSEVDANTIERIIAQFGG